MSLPFSPSYCVFKALWASRGERTALCKPGLKPVLLPTSLSEEQAAPVSLLSLQSIPAQLRKFQTENSNSGFDSRDMYLTHIHFGSKNHGVCKGKGIRNYDSIFAIWSIGSG